MIITINKQIPVSSFKNQCDVALRMALGQMPQNDCYDPMSQSEIKEILDEYDRAVDAENAGTPAWREATKKRDLVEKLFAQ